MITSSSETHTETTIPESLQTHVRGFLAAARVCVRGGRGAGAGRVKAVVAVIVAALLAGGLVAPAGGSSVRGAFANLQLVSSVPGELTISWDLPDPQPSDYRIMWAEEGLGFLSYRFANEALRGNEYPDGEATSVTLTGLTEGATYMVKARSRYSSGGRNNSRWSGPWSDKVTASVSVAAPVAQEPGDDQQQVNDPETQGNEQQVNDPETQGNEQQVDDPQVQGNEQQVDDPQVQGNDQQQQGDDQQQQRDDSSVVSGKSVEDDEAVSEDRASRSEPADDDLSAGTDTVGAVELDSAALGTISDGFSLWDADWFAAELVAGSTYVIEVLGAGAGADCTLRGPVLERVYDADGTAVAGTETWDDGRDSLTKLTFTPASPGTYFVSVAGEANAAGTGTYILALTAAGPRSSERVAAIGAEGCVPTAPDKNADNTATSRIAPKKTSKPPPENNRITARSSHILASSEPSGGDLPASEDTTGVVVVGQISSGSLFEDDRVGVNDERLVSVETFTRDRDWFKLVGLQAGSLYRVEVHFIGDGVVGGGIQMYQSTWGRTPVARSDRWDSNYDGNAVIDFKPIQSERAVTKWIMIESPNGTGSGPNRFHARNYFTGDYTVTLTDITGLRTMVANTGQREDDGLIHSVIGDLAKEGRGVRVIANMFTTGTHTAGYTLDSITAYIRAGLTPEKTTIKAEIEEIVDTHTEDDNVNESDLITFSEDSVDFTVRSATVASTNAEPAVSIHASQISDGEDVPVDSEVCTLEPLNNYITGLNLLTGDWPDRLYGGCGDITLTANTKYWIVFHSHEEFPTSFYNVARANSSNEDSGSADGWSIGNFAKLREKTVDWSTDWIERTYALAFGIHATPK